MWNLYHKQCRCDPISGMTLYFLPVFRKNLSSLIQNGASTLFWLDNWVKGHVSADIWSHLFQLAQCKEESIRDFMSRMSVFPLNDFPASSNLINDTIVYLSSAKDKKHWNLTAN